MGDFYIDEVYPKEDAYALLAHFQNGYPADEFADQQCVVLAHKTTGKKCIATEINKILYNGDESDEPLGKTLLLVRNRNTSKVRLMEVGNVELKPVLEDATAPVELEASYIDLGRKFGSKRHKKKLEQNEKLKLNEDVVMEQLQDVSHNISKEQVDMSAYNKTDSEDFYIPTINREATNLADVYNVSEILTDEQYETIFNEIDTANYRSHLFPCIKEIFTENWTKEQTVLAVYASSLLSMYNKNMTVLKQKKFVACPSSATLDAIILKKFFTYNNDHRMRPTHYKDKTLCHAIVFIYLINKYKMDLDMLCKHFKMVEKTANMKVNMTGAWTVKEGGKKIAVLKLPLNKTTNVRRRTARF